jgi:hypothetical protein
VYVYTFGVSETTLFSLKGGKLFLQKRKKNKSEKINNNNKKKKEGGSQSRITLVTGLDSQKKKENKTWNALDRVSFADYGGGSVDLNRLSSIYFPSKLGLKKKKPHPTNKKIETGYLLVSFKLNSSVCLILFATFFSSSFF